MPCGNVFKAFKLRPRKKQSKNDSIVYDSSQENQEEIFSRKSNEIENEKAHQKDSLSENKPVDTERLQSPIQPPSDNKKYSVFRLSNGIEVTIISDVENISVEDANSETQKDEKDDNLGEKSTHISSPIQCINTSEEPERNFRVPPTQVNYAAMALTIQTGTFNDPDDIPGLTHLMEHVVSMGSVKYPDENQFEDFIEQQGGTSNAETESEYITFYFECQEKHLFKTIDIFSQFFISPLLRWSSVHREAQIVDNEFAGLVNSDNVRRLQLICSWADEKNPARKFSWGNMETLYKNVENEKLFKALNNYKNNFTGNRMKIALQARLPEARMKKWITHYFSDIPSAENAPTTYTFTNPFDMKQFCKFYRVQAIAEICEININWSLPPMNTYYRTKPLEYLSYVIGHEGEGSVISYLRKRQWALFLTAEVEEGGLVSNSIYTIFTITVSLTQEGRAQIKEVISGIFGYLKMLRQTDPSENVYNELKQLADTNFRLNQNVSAIENVVMISQNMTMFPSKDYLGGWALFYDYNPTVIRDYLMEMVPSKANFLLHAKNHDEVLNQEEHWFKTKYKVDEVPKEWLDDFERVVPHEGFCLPKPNEYIPTDFTLVNHQKVTKHPEKLIETDLYEVWHKGINSLQHPYVTLHILINEPTVSQTAEHTACLVLLNKLFTYQMINELYSANVAQIECKLTANQCGMEIFIQALRQQLNPFLKTVALGLKTLKEAIETEDSMLESLKIVQQKNMINILTNGEELVKDTRKALISDNFFTSGEKYFELKKITKEKLSEYWDNLFKAVYIQVLVEGSILADEAKNLINEFVEILQFGSTPKSELPPTSVKEVLKGETVVSISPYAPDNKNCYTQLFYQYGPGNVKDSVALQLFVAMLNKPLLYELHTKERLGYNLSASVSDVEGILGIVVSVKFQTEKFSAYYVQTRLDSFLKGSLRGFKMLTQKRFNESKQMFLALKRLKPATLKDSALKDWWEIKYRHYDFDRTDKEIQALEDLDKTRVIKVAEPLLNAKRNEVRKLIVQVTGWEKPPRELSELEGEGLINSEITYRSFNSSERSSTNILEWKKSLPNYPTPSSFPEEKKRN